MPRTGHCGIVDHVMTGGPRMLAVRSVEVVTLREEEAARAPVNTETWIVELRDRLVDAGHDRRRVDDLISSTLARFRSARLQGFVPILVERSVRGALHSDRDSPPAANDR
jgi:hypothetical protein